MYACMPEIGRGFFEGVCAPCKTTVNFRDPPPPIRELTPANASRSKGERDRWYVVRPVRSIGHLRGASHKCVYIVVVAVVQAMNVL